MQTSSMHKNSDRVSSENYHLRIETSLRVSSLVKLFSQTHYSVIITKKLYTISDTNLSCAVADVAPEVAVCC